MFTTQCKMCRHDLHRMQTFARCRVSLERRKVSDKCAVREIGNASDVQIDIWYQMEEESFEIKTSRSLFRLVYGPVLLQITDC